MPGRISALIAALALGLAATFSAAAGPLTQIPSSAAASPKEFWRGVMEQFYGGYDGSLKCWIGEIDGARQCMRPHRLDTVVVDGRTLHFVVTGGYAVTEGGGRPDCHACPGSLGMIVLGETGDRMELVARNSLAEPAGAWGAVPGEDEFRLRETGPGRYGWTMRTGWTGQGYTLGHEVVYGVSGSDVVELGSIPVHADNGGVCGDGMGECFVHDYDLVFDAGTGEGRYDIVLRKRPESTGGPDTLRAPFDASALTYRMPDEAEALFGL